MNFPIVSTFGGFVFIAAKIYKKGGMCKTFGKKCSAKAAYCAIVFGQFVRNDYLCPRETTYCTNYMNYTNLYPMYNIILL